MLIKLPGSQKLHYRIIQKQMKKYLEKKYIPDNKFIRYYNESTITRNCVEINDKSTGKYDSGNIKFKTSIRSVIIYVIIEMHTYLNCNNYWGR